MSDGWIRTEKGWRKSYGPPKSSRAPSGFPCPRLNLDGMDPVEHVDGRFYDSKSAFRRVTRENGLVEVGNDAARLRQKEKPKADPKKRREAVEKAVSRILG